MFIVLLENRTISISTLFALTLAEEDLMREFTVGVRVFCLEANCRARLKRKGERANVRRK